MDIDHWFCAILLGDKVIHFGNRNSDPVAYFYWDQNANSWRLDGLRPPGEYIAVQLGRAMLDGGFYGLADVDAFVFTLPETPGESREPDVRAVQLTAAQGKSVIEALNADSPYMWKNATESSRGKLSG